MLGGESAGVGRAMIRGAKVVDASGIAAWTWTIGWGGM